MAAGLYTVRKARTGHDPLGGERRRIEHERVVAAQKAARVADAMAHIRMGHHVL